MLAVALGLAGIWHRLVDLRRAQRPRAAASRWAQTLLEHKFYFDELYDLLFYRPAVLLATGLVRVIERPLVLGSVRELVRAFREAGRGTGRLQTGLVRTYALSIAASLAVVTVVFVAVR